MPDVFVQTGRDGKNTTLSEPWGRRLATERLHHEKEWEREEFGKKFAGMLLNQISKLCGAKEVARFTHYCAEQPHGLLVAPLQL